MDWEAVIQGLRNLHIALERDKQMNISMLYSGDLMRSLTQNKITNRLSEIFRGGDVMVTLCLGKIVSPPEARTKIITEYHDNLIVSHKYITKTVRTQIREPMFITDMPSEPFYKVFLNTVGKLPASTGKCRHSNDQCSLLETWVLRTDARCGK